MKNPEESYTIIVFRGARANPLRLKVRRAIVRNALIAGICLLVLQSGILTHYVFQWSQVIELDGIRKELSNSRERTSTFAGEIDGMKKRMVSLELLNRKLQTMFGLEPDEIEGFQGLVPGQGGEEIPFDTSPRKVRSQLSPLQRKQRLAIPCTRTGPSATAARRRSLSGSAKKRLTPQLLLF